MADAAHLLSDCISFIVAIIAIWWARKPSDDRMSFGYKRLGKFREENLLIFNVADNLCGLVFTKKNPVPSKRSSLKDFSQF